MTKKTNFGPNLAIFGPKTLIFMGVSKSFGNHIMEKPPGQLLRIVFGLAWEQIGQKCRYLAPNASFGPNLAVFGQTSNFFGGRNKTFGTLISAVQ